MSAIIYLLQVSACLALFYSFYYLMLNRLTFFTINRYYLLFTLVLSFVIPLLTIPVHQEYSAVPVMQQVVNMRSVQNVPVYIAPQTNAIKTDASINWMQLLKWGYLVAVVGLFTHLLITLTSFFVKLRRRKISSMGNIHILRGDKKLPNGSFLNYIFLNDDELSAEEMEQIVAHEMLHVKLYHSADRILMKLVQIILWFNPFVYLYARSMEENHEFEVDREITTSGDKNKYADLLVHLSVANQGMLYHSFSKVPLKKRITMLFNKPSANMKKIIYVLVLPILLVSCLAFARLKTDDPKPVSVIYGIKNLGKNPLVLIDKKVYPASILYKISDSAISGYSTGDNWAIKKYGKKAKDGVVVITTKKGKISYMTQVEKENLIKMYSAPSGFYTRLILKKENGGNFVRVKIASPRSWAYSDMPMNGKVGFIINDKLYDETTFKKLVVPAFQNRHDDPYSIGSVEKPNLKLLVDRGYHQDVSGYDAILYMRYENTNNKPRKKSGTANPIKKPDNNAKNTLRDQSSDYYISYASDTTEYSTKAFNADPNAKLIDVLFELPGFDKNDNEVFNLGKKIEKISINNKEFNGTVMQSIKNLPAAGISRIQIIHSTGNSPASIKMNVITTAK